MLLLALLTAAATAHAGPTEATEPPRVIVPGAKIAIGWPYAVLAEGMDAFDDGRHDLAPRAGLRFRLLLTPGVTALDNVVMTLVDGDRLTPVPLALDGFFTLARQDLPGDAELAVNRNVGQFDANRTPQPDVRTPGLPDNVRRMGDLRLECRVKMAMARHLFGFMQSAAISLAGGTDWCAPRKGGGYSVNAGRPVAHAALAEEGRALALAVKAGAAAIPIADPSWSDDALVTFD
ncbi:hypothetical protein [Pseudoduganella lutea]|uniref:Uncharacterized protein n=1 Tax=Pseudoduganella lutea TaxID=321985 RepID=A0A4P6L3W2_9BURK|nr:hypothetical protein [Pseudoduganella lutea]QBE66137.1 hypothetical protein EWM63_26750 [Pseudoduganella lutea]